MTFGVPAYGDGPFAAPPDTAAASMITSRNVVLLSPRAFDYAAVTAASEVASLPVTNLQNVQPRKLYRSPDASAAITIVLSAAKACNAMALIGGNPSSSRVVRVTGAASLVALNATPLIDTDWISPWIGGSIPDEPDWPSWTQIVSWGNDAALRYWKLEIADAGVANVDLGRVMIDRFWQPSINFDFGGTPLAFDPRDVATETDYGFTFTDRRTKSAPRRFAISFSGSSQIDVLKALQQIQRLAGFAGDVVCCLDPGDTDNFHLLTMQGRFTKAAAYGAPAAWNDDGTPLWSASIELREFL